MSLGGRLNTAEQQTPEPPAPHVRQPALADYTPTTVVTIPSPYPPTYNDALHPDVVDTVTGFAGYRYWMAFTPYPGSSDPLENPCIVASHDGDTWVVPAGLTNPIDPYPGGSNYNSDTDLVYVPADGLLYCFYRHYGNSHKCKTSADGVHWSDEISFLIEGSNSNAQLSPAYIRMNANYWRVWWIEFGDRTLRTAKADNPFGPWTEDTICSIDIPPGLGMWHVDVIRYAGLFYTLIYCDGGSGAVIGGVSYDGLEWGESTDILCEGRSGFGPLYRSTLQPTEGGFDVWVTGNVASSDHRVGRTFIPIAEFSPVE